MFSPQGHAVMVFLAATPKLAGSMAATIVRVQAPGDIVLVKYHKNSESHTLYPFVIVKWQTSLLFRRYFLRT